MSLETLFVDFDWNLGTKLVRDSGTNVLAVVIGPKLDECRKLKCIKRLLEENKIRFIIRFVENRYNNN